MAQAVKSPPDGKSPPLFDVFLSHNSQEKQSVERIAEKLKREAIEPWLDKWCLTPGGDWQDELAAGLHVSAACAVFVGPHGIGDWERLEFKLATDRMAKDRNFRTFLVLLPDLPEPFDTSTLPPFLSTRTWVDLRRGISDPRAFQLLINAIKGIAPGPSVPIERREDICPYRGLQAFDEEHAEFFFGREADIQRLIEKLKATRLLAVLGPSGSGKSSLVRAGLIPAIRRGSLHGSDTWPVRTFTPGARPLTNLAANLVRLNPQAAVGKTLDELSAEERALHLGVSVALADRRQSEQVVWVVDQFEEVFTLCQLEAEREQFISNLLYAATIPGGRSVVVLTMRADFYQKCAAYPELSAQIAGQQFLVSPMTLDALRQTIEEPAWRVGLEFEQGLVETILDDVARQPGALPLLEHALLELWERRRGRLMTLEAYRESGGVEGAIARRADAIYETFDAEQQVIVRRVMLRLTQPGEGTEDTRRRATMGELITHPEEAEKVQSVVRAMADARLLTTDSIEDANKQVVDVSHEALIRGWPRLRKWIEEDRHGLRVHRRLTEAAGEWERTHRDQSLLFRGARLTQTAEWRENNQGALNELERDFLDASLALQTEERVAAQRRTRRIVAGLAIALTLISIASIIAFLQSRKATKRGEEAFARELAANALAQLTVNPELGLLLAVEAAKRAETVETENALRQALVKSPLRILHVSRTDDGPLWVFSPDATRIMTTNKNKVQVWDIESGRLLFEVPHDTSLAAPPPFSPDGKLIATGTGREVQVWDAGTGSSIARWPVELEYPDIESFSPDSKFLLVSDMQLQVRDVRSGRVVADLEGGSPTFSRDGKLMMTKGEKLYVYDPNGWKLLGEIQSELERWENRDFGALSPDGRYIFANSENSKGVSIQFYDAQTRTKVYEGSSTSNLRLATFSPDGTLAAAAPSSGGAFWVWTTPHGVQIEFNDAPSPLESISFSPDSRFVLTVTDAARLYDVKSHERRLIAEIGNTGGLDVSRAEFSPDGKYILTASADGTVSVWDLNVWRNPVETTLENAVFSATSSNSFVFSPDGKFLAKSEIQVLNDQPPYSVTVWDVAGGQIIKTFSHSDSVESAVFSPDAHLILTKTKAGTVWVWDFSSGRSLAELKHGERVATAAFSHDGKLVVTASGPAARIWDAQSGKLLDELSTGSDTSVRVKDAKLSPDGKSILIVVGGKAQVRNLSDKRTVLEMDDGEVIINADYSPDGKLILTSKEMSDKREEAINPPEIRDAKTGRVVAELRGHVDNIYGASFSRNSKYVVTVSGYTLNRGSVGGSPSINANEVRVWDVSSGNVFYEFKGQNTPMLAGTFTTDGKSVLAVAETGAVLVYPCEVCVPQNELLKLASKRQLRPLTADERARYLHEQQP
jgi:WD40 repeat protein/energy-coupling factor transporter ATP-binding protein EcfA2